jgi:hypothetical protein
MPKLFCDILFKMPGKGLCVKEPHKKYAKQFQQASQCSVHMNNN